MNNSIFEKAGFYMNDITFSDTHLQCYPCLRLTFDIGQEKHVLKWTSSQKCIYYWQHTIRLSESTAHESFRHCISDNASKQNTQKYQTTIDNTNWFHTV